MIILTQHLMIRNIKAMICLVNIREVILQKPSFVVYRTVDLIIRDDRSIISREIDTQKKIYFSIIRRASGAKTL